MANTQTSRPRSKGKGGKPFWANKGPRADDQTKPVDEMAKTISVTLAGSSARFISEETGFAIWTAEHHEDKHRAISIKGDGLGDRAPGETLRCEGKWNAPKGNYGWTFQVFDFQVALPTGAKGIEMWLAASVPGVGPTFAKAIVVHFGAENVFQALDLDVERMREVKSPSGRKISANQVEKAIEAWDDVKAIREIEAFLFEHGVSKGLAAKLYRRYGPDVIAILQTEPYIVTELPGVGFVIADTIARSMGIGINDPRRVKAGVSFLLKDGEQQGHVFITFKEICKKSIKLLNVADEHLLAEQIALLHKEKKVIVESDGDNAEQRIYARYLYEQETRLAAKIRELLENPMGDLFKKPTRPTAPEGATDEQVASLALPSDQQWSAIELVRLDRLTLLLGGPGVGKTFTVSTVVEQTKRAGKKIALAAPTGKAARRMMELTGEPAMTIHRLLEFNPNEGGFQRDEENVLECDLLVIDEASMLSLDLADSLFSAIGPRTHVLLVGDPDQLPPVGAGRVLADLIESKRPDDTPAVPRVHLTKIFRQAAKSMIVQNAQRINKGLMPYLKHEDAVEALGSEMDEDFFFLGATSYERVLAVTLEMVCNRIPRVYGLDPKRDIMAIAPMRKGPLGLEALNRALEENLNGPVNGVAPQTVLGSIRVGSRIMQTKNDYTPEKEVMNGELAIVKAFNEEKKEALLSLDDGEREIWIPTVSMDSFVLGWASSVHKAQGSEWPCVVFISSTAHYVMNTRSLLYTAITRARKLCVVIGHAEDDRRGSVAAMSDAVKRADTSKRNSLLAPRVTNPALSGVLF